MSSKRQMDLCSAVIVLIINCFVWNVHDFPGDVLFEQGSLILKGSHHSWQQEDAVAGSTCPWSGVRAVAEPRNESIMLHPQKCPCPKVRGWCLSPLLLQCVRLQLAFPCNRKQWDISSFPWSHDALAIQATYSQAHRRSSDMGTQDPQDLNSLTQSLPYL